MSIRIEGDEELQRFLENMPQELFESAKDAVRTRTLSLQSRLVRKFGQGGPLNRRTGSAARSIKTSVKGSSLDNLSGVVYGDATLAPYLGVHETGKTIRAKKAYRRLPGGPYLNIPIGENLTPAGVMRQNAREVFQSGGRIVGTRSSGYVVIDAIGEPMFVLKKSVVIPARLGAAELARDEFRLLSEDLNRIIDEATDNA